MPLYDDPIEMVACIHIRENWRESACLHVATQINPGTSLCNARLEMAFPEGLEPPIFWFVAKYSIQIELWEY